MEGIGFCGLHLWELFRKCLLLFRKYTGRLCLIEILLCFYTTTLIYSGFERDLVLLSPAFLLWKNRMEGIVWITEMVKFGSVRLFGLFSLALFHLLFHVNRTFEWLFEDPSAIFSQKNECRSLMHYEPMIIWKLIEKLQCHFEYCQGK